MSKKVIITFHFDEGDIPVECDASVSEQHNVSAQVTEHQVEKGSDITDHVRIMPQQLQIDAIITNHPIAMPSTQMHGVTGQESVLQTAQGLKYKAFSFSDSFDRVKDVHSIVMLAVSRGVLVDIATTLATYTDMAIESYPVYRNAQTGNILQFSLSLKQIRTVDTVEVAALPAQIAPKVAKKNRGTKAPKEASTQQADAATQKTSLLKAALGVLTRSQ